MKEINDNKIAIYSRKSRFTGKGDSIGNQIELCKKEIFQKYPEIKEEDILIFEDEGYSGGNTNRPQFQEMMKQAKEHKFKALVCYKLDRISRNVGDFSDLIEDLDDFGIIFISVRENFDTKSPMGRAMMNIVSVFAQLERETIAERIRDNMYELAKTGRWLGGTTPTGYKSEKMQKITIDGKIRQMYKLSILPDEAETIKKIFEKFLEFNSLTKTETYLLNNGYKTKNGKEYTRFTIKGILTNPVYMVADKTAYDYFVNKQIELFSDETKFDGKCAIMAYNKTLQKPNKAIEKRDIEDWIISVGKHKGIISSTNWIKVQELLEQNNSKAYRKPKSNEALLSGLLICGNCGSYMRPKKTTRKNAKGDYIYDYLCELKEKSRRVQCDMNRPNGNTLDAMVVERIKELSAKPSAYIDDLKSAQKAIMDDRENFCDEIKRLEKELQDNNKAIKACFNSLPEAEEKGIKSLVLDEIKENQEKKTMLEQQLEELKRVSASNNLTSEEFDVLQQLLTSFAETFDGMDIEAKRIALRTFVQKVIWDGEYVHVYLFGSPEDDIESPDGLLSNREPLCEDSK